MQLYCMQLARLEEAGMLTDTIAGLAKLNNTRKARQVIAEARDLLGGNGVLLENHVIRHMGDIEVIHTYEGTETMQTLIVGRDITGVGAFADPGSGRAELQDADPCVARSWIITAASSSAAAQRDGGPLGLRLADVLRQRRLAILGLDGPDAGVAGPDVEVAVVAGGGGPARRGGHPKGGGRKTGVMGPPGRPSGGSGISVRRPGSATPTGRGRRTGPRRPSRRRRARSVARRAGRVSCHAVPPRSATAGARGPARARPRG